VEPHGYGTEDHRRENLAHFGLSTIVQPTVAPSVAAAGACSVLRISNPLKETGCENGILGVYP